MFFQETALHGAYVIHIEPIEDERGFFARAWCQEQAVGRGLDVNFVQCSISYTRKKGTLRGMHYQAPPHEEAKLVRCTRGAIYDVMLDLRPGSSTFKRWIAVELTAAEYRALYVPRGCAHGFQTLEDETEVFYQISAFHDPACARGVRWDDPAFGMQWPLPVTCISTKDREIPDSCL